MPEVKLQHKMESEQQGHYGNYSTVSWFGQ